MKVLVAIVAALSLILLFPPASAAATAPAHWAGTGERTIYVENHLPAEWLTPLKAAVADWNRSPYINIVLTTDDDCWDFDSQVAFCWSTYDPMPSWIGLSSWWVDPQGHFRYVVNEANALKYWGSGKRRFVACHELGHALGLVEPSTTSGQDCMMSRFSYITVYPPRPTSVNYAKLVTLYSHDD